MVNHKAIILFFISTYSTVHLNAAKSPDSRSTAIAKATSETSRVVDNTAINKRDAEGMTITPEDQTSGSKSDVEITRRIRRLVTKEDSLSTSAKNIKIVTRKGTVTLRGVVQSLEESNKVQTLAQQVAGEGVVTNELEVKANK